ncbi:MAG: hypothetical protein R3Y56_03610 [Akkermansia sp.]
MAFSSTRKPRFFLSRAATATTPASVTAYQRDAMGRELRRIENVGEFFRFQANSYDPLFIVDVVHVLTFIVHKRCT